MLYKNLFIFVAVTFIVFHVCTLNGAEYHVYVGEDCTNYPLTANDTCIIHCDTKRQTHISFDCGDASQCIFNCEQQKCFERGILNAKNINNLKILSSARECLKRSVINLPDHGNVSLSMNAAKSFKEMTINSGINTQNIIMDCTFGAGEECKAVTINAQNAQYLQINIGSNSALEGTSKRKAIINCPQNSSYSGPQRSACIIDVSNGGKLSLVQINTLYGIPNDVWIKTGTNILSDVQITCIDGLSNNLANSFMHQGNCWMSNTFSPTYFPTNQPTRTSTPIAHTMHSTVNNIHIVSTTFEIVNTLYLMHAMTTDDIIHLVKYDTNKENRNIFTSNIILFSGIIATIVLFCCIGLRCYIKKRSSKANNNNGHVIQYELKSNSSKHVVKITMSSLDNNFKQRQSNMHNMHSHTRVASNYSDNIIDALETNNCSAISASIEDVVNGDNINETNDRNTSSESEMTV